MLREMALGIRGAERVREREGGMVEWSWGKLDAVVWVSRVYLGDAGGQLQV